MADLASAGLEVSHPLLEQRDEVKNSALLVLTANRGLCGGYNGNVLRLATKRRTELQEMGGMTLEVSGKRGISGFKFRDIPVDTSYTHFEDQPKFIEVDEIADRLIRSYIGGEIDRLDVVYTKFLTSARQEATVETLLPLGNLEGADTPVDEEKKSESVYEFFPICGEHFGGSRAH